MTTCLLEERLLSVHVYFKYLTSQHVFVIDHIWLSSSDSILGSFVGKFYIDINQPSMLEMCYREMTKENM